jgi:hypothetical protein
VSFNEQSLRQSARSNVNESFKKGQGATVNAETLLIENNVQRKSEEDKIDVFDIFLSHNSLDAEIILGILNKLKDLGYRVYVDWVIDTHLERHKITIETIHTLKLRMNQCKCLFYASTKNASLSKWMPWELGYMDGKKAKAAILPIFGSDASSSHKFKGQEYLGVYPYCIEAASTSEINKLWICETKDRYVSFDKWLKGINPYKR